jgi:hypothetical protein
MTKTGMGQNVSRKASVMEELSGGKFAPSICPGNGEQASRMSLVAAAYAAGRGFLFRDALPLSRSLEFCAPVGAMIEP